MADYLTIASIKLKFKHHQSGKTRHFIQGGLMNKPDALKIVKFEGDEGYYLLYLDQNGNELTDTYHNTLIDALDQAQMEFDIKHNEWD